MNSELIPSLTKVYWECYAPNNRTGKMGLFMPTYRKAFFRLEEAERWAEQFKHLDAVAVRVEETVKRKVVK